MRFASAFASVLCLVGLSSAPAIAQDSGAAAPPTPAPPAASELPPVEVIQKKATPTPKAAQKKSAPKKQVAAPAPQPAPVAPVQPTGPWSPARAASTAAPSTCRPLPGSEIPIGKYPAAVGRASSEDIAKFHEASVPEVLQNTVPGVVISDAQGNVYQRNAAVSRLRSLARQRRAAGPRRLSERRAHQRRLRRHRQLGLPARQRHRRHLHPRRQSGLRPQRARRRRRHRHARRLQLPGRRDRQRASAPSATARARSPPARAAATGAPSSPAKVHQGRRLPRLLGSRNQAHVRRHRRQGRRRRVPLQLHRRREHVGVTAAAPEQLLDLDWTAPSPRRRRPTTRWRCCRSTAR